MEQKIVILLQNINDKVPSNPMEELLASGIIDSFDIVNIVSSLEQEFCIKIDAEDIVPENFVSVHSIMIMVGKYVDNERGIL